MLIIQKKNASPLFYLVLCLVLLTSCGYQLGYDGVAANYKTIAVPSVIGDSDGDLTSCLVKAITSSGCLEYRQGHAAAVLNVKLIEVVEDNIGFRYDRHKDGKIRHTIIPTETRLKGVVEINLVDSCSGTAVLGPLRLVAYEDFDHDYYTSRNGVNIFSLGQLNDYDEAYDAAMHPLNVTLAQKIVDYICNSW